jgi:hypothetical protein
MKVKKTTKEIIEKKQKILYLLLNNTKLLGSIFMKTFLYKLFFSSIEKPELVI